MSELERLNRLMTEIGPYMGVAGVFVTEEDVAWEIVLAEGFALTLEYAEADDRLTITGDIAELGERPPGDLLILMLQYNAASTETGGVRLALDANLRALQIFDTPVQGLTLDGLKVTLLGLADKIVAWQGALQGRLHPSDVHNDATFGVENLIKA